jgi:hypothetical protein
MRSRVRRRPLGALRIDRIGGSPVAWLDVGGHDVWQVSCCLTAQGRRAVVREVRIGPKPGADLPDGGLPASVVRELSFGDVVDTFARIIEAYWAPPGSALRPSLRGLDRVFPFLTSSEPPPRWAPAAVMSKPRGRRPLSDEELLRASQAYADALRRRSKQPVRDAARQLGETSPRVRDLLNKARRRGFLTLPMHQGRAGGQLTPKARALLDAQPPARPRRPQKRRQRR